MIATQPRPLALRVGYFRREPGVNVTAITRLWAAADVARCGLCPRFECTARPVSVGGRGGRGPPGVRLCVVVAEGIIPEDACELHSTRGPGYVQRTLF